MHTGASDRMRKKSAFRDADGFAGAHRNKRTRSHRQARRAARRWLEEELAAHEGECQAEREVEERRQAEIQEDLAMIQLLEEEEERLFDELRMEEEQHQLDELDELWGDEP